MRHRLSRVLVQASPTLVVAYAVEKASQWRWKLFRDAREVKDQERAALAFGNEWSGLKKATETRPQAFPQEPVNCLIPNAECPIPVSQDLVMEFLRRSRFQSSLPSKRGICSACMRQQLAVKATARVSAARNGIHESSRRPESTPGRRSFTSPSSSPPLLLRRSGKQTPSRHGERSLPRRSLKLSTTPSRGYFIPPSQQSSSPPAAQAVLPSRLFSSPSSNTTNASSLSASSAPPPTRSWTPTPFITETVGGAWHTYDIFSRLLKERIICVNGTVDDTVSASVVAQLLFLEADSPDKPISLYINSPGGSVTAGLAIYDCMTYIQSEGMALIFLYRIITNMLSSVAREPTTIGDG